MTRVLILGDESKGRVRALVESSAVRLREQGHQVEVELDRFNLLKDRRAELVVVFGGDGSILGAARRMRDNQMPTLGINLGRLGFLTAFPDDECDQGIDLALKGALIEQPRMMLHCLAYAPDGKVLLDELCLNDAVLAREPLANMIEVSAWRRDAEVAVYPGDGLIVSTPVGSTAYSLAAGGPIVSPRMDAMLLMPLAPHTLTLRPLILPAAAGIDLKVEECGGEPTCALTIDGQISVALVPGSRVHFEPATQRFRHLTRGSGSFFRILRDKFGWADTPRRP